MEHWGNNQNYVSSAMHTPSSFGNTVNHGGQTIPTVSTNFHVYTLEWTDESMVFSVDGVIHYVYHPALKDANTWPFNGEQYLLLNIAIEPSIAANFTESTMEIDYVRIYQEPILSLPEATENFGIKLFPNPAENKLNLEVAQGFIGKEAFVYSSLGKLVKRLPIIDIQNILDISGLSNGIYLIKIEHNSIRFVKK
jgi:beta-glucanase (GH16 family)